MEGGGSDWAVIGFCLPVILSHTRPQAISQTAQALSVENWCVYLCVSHEGKSNQAEEDMRLKSVALSWFLFSLSVLLVLKMKAAPAAVLRKKSLTGKILCASYESMNMKQGMWRSLSSRLISLKGGSWLITPLWAQSGFQTEEKYSHWSVKKKKEVTNNVFWKRSEAVMLTDSCYHAFNNQTFFGVGGGHKPSSTFTLIKAV